MKIKSYKIKGEKYCKFADVLVLVKEVKEKAKKINLQGWQGKDKLDITKKGTEWHITEHRKDKESGEVAQQTHVVPEAIVADLWTIIRKRAITVGEKTKYREIVTDIIFKNHIPVSLDEFNGGHNRSKYLFPLYYYPMKVLEAEKYVKYGGRGQVTRLK